jgi:lysophospholipase L1-like esterase
MGRFCKVHQAEESVFPGIIFNTVGKADMVTRQPCASTFVCFAATLFTGLGLLASPACAQVPSHPVSPGRSQSDRTWVTSWGSSQLQPYGTEVVPTGVFEQSTLRQVVHLSAGGASLRVCVSNAFGTEALQLLSVSVAMKDAAGQPGSIVPGSDRKLHFHGRTSLSVPMGAEYVSDAIDLPVAPLSDLVVTLSIEHAPATVTVHPGARATSFLAAGDHSSDATLPKPQTFARWYFLSNVEVAGGHGPVHSPRGSVIALGDSITDGHAATTDGNDRWTDVLARRLAASRSTSLLGVVNEGIGGNHILSDGLGPNAMARFERDVLSIPGARDLIVLEGINDLGGLDRTEPHAQAVHDALVQDLETAMAQMVERAHEGGLRVFGGTLTPYAGSEYYHPAAMSEADRVRLNEWIRTSGTFDGVIDFDAALRDPQYTDRLLPAFDSGDHLHPGPAGYKRMGEAVPLGLFLR